MPDRLRIAVLGPVRAWIGEREIDLGAARRRAVFAVLAARSGDPIGRDELIEAIWGGAAPATAAGNIYTYISGLRRTLGPDHITSTDGYAVRVDAVDLDAREFQRLCSAASALDQAGDLAGAARRLGEALALWHGDAYAGLTSSFVDLDRQRLTAERLAAVERRAGIRLELGDDDGLIGEMAAFAGAHPLHEPAHELLVRALLGAGRRDEARTAFRAAERLLRAELGVEPGPALEQLRRRLPDGRTTPVASNPARSRQDRSRPDRSRPDRSRPDGPRPGGAVRDGLAGRPHFGRHADIAYHRGLVQAVAAGTGGAVWIDGEAGIGKTELLTAAFADAAERGCRLAWAAADELSERVSLRVLCRALGLGEAGDGKKPAAHGTEPATAVERVLAHVRAACATTPMVLVVDDMHWADATTLLVWERLVGTTTRLPLLLVAASRPEPHSRELAQLRRGVQARQQRPTGLHPLPAADLERLVGTLVGAPLGPNLRALVARAGGNPLYAREMVAALLRKDAVRVGRVAEVDAAVSAEPPASLLAAVRGTVEVLSPATRDVLRIAALLGTEFSVGDVVAVTGRAPFDLMRDLEEALAANVLVDSGTELAFRHPFLRRALVDGVPAQERAGLRHRVLPG